MLLTGPATLQLRGADVSSTLLEERAGIRVRDQGHDEPVERILARHGASHVRLRIWVDPIPGWNDMESALTMARRAEEAGLRLLVDLHYSDTWADPRNQNPPARWRGQDLAELCRSVETYTRDVVEAFARQGTPPEMIQIGNEISHGLLWPVGRIPGDDDSWVALARLLRAGIDGAGPGPRIMIHTDLGGDNGAARHFYDRLTAHDVAFDVVGLSYYPFWHGPLAGIRDNMVDLALRYDRDVVVVEAAYPWTLDNPAAHPDRFCTSTEQLPDSATYPPTPAGQAAFFEALRGCLGRVPGGHGLGFVVWEPAWLDGVGWGPGAPNPFANLTLFDHRGRALPALRALRPPDS